MWGSFILSLLGKAIQDKETGAANKRTSRAVEAAGEKQAEKNKAARDATMKGAEAFDPTKRQERMDTAASTTEGNINKLLSEAATADTGKGSTGKVSQNVLKDRAQTVRDRANTASILAALTSKIRAPGEAGVEEAKGLRRTAETRSDLSEEARRRAMMDEGLIREAGKVNQGRMMLGGGLQAAGMTMASGDIMSKLNPATGLNYSPIPVTDPYANFFKGIAR